MLNRNKNQFLEGSRAIALTILNIQPDVISAYPITPQTHIIEDLAHFKLEKKANFEYLQAESEFAAASILVGASAAGVRTYSATSSQGVLLMMEVLHNAAGLRLPLVLTIANRALSGPINIFNDHSDAMAMKDSSWIMLFAENHQEAVDLHVIAYKIAELLEIPVAVNVDGFIITHAYETVIIPDTKTIKRYLPKYNPPAQTYLDSKYPISLGSFFAPKQYSQARKQLSLDLLKSQTTIRKEYKSWHKLCRHPREIQSIYDDGLIEYYGSKKAKTLLIAMGSVCGTIKAVIQNNPDVALIKIRSFRPFPALSLNKIISPQIKNIAVIEKVAPTANFSPLFTEIKSNLNNFSGNMTNHIVGLGGTDISEALINKIIKYQAKTSLKFW